MARKPGHAGICRLGLAEPLPAARARQGMPLVRTWPPRTMHFVNWFGEKMFTGIIDHCGSVTSVERRGDSLVLAIACAFVDVEEGESIAVDGVCLTAISRGKCVPLRCFSRDPASHPSRGL